MEYATDSVAEGWFSVKVESSTGKIINLIVCNTTEVHFMWQFAAQACILANVLQPGAFGKREQRTSAYAQLFKVAESIYELKHEITKGDFV